MAIFATAHAVTLPDLLAVATAGGTAACGTIGLLVRAKDIRESISNLASGVAVGAFAGALIAFVIYAAKKVA